MSFLTQLNVTERIPIQRSSNGQYKHNEKEKTKRKLKRFQDKGYSTKGAQLSSAYSFVIIAIFFAAPFHRSSKWLAARCLMASRFLVFFLFGVVLARPFFPHFSPMDSKTVRLRWLRLLDMCRVPPWRRDPGEITAAHAERYLQPQIRLRPLAKLFMFT